MVCRLARPSMEPSKPTPKVVETVLYVPKPRMKDSDTVLGRDLADRVRNRAVRQLLISYTPAGWELRALPTWTMEFMTLVSLKKEKRHYQDLERLVSTITKHGPLPPTILIGNSTE